MDFPKPSGSNIAYHLRHHKAIERNIFIDLLKKLNASASMPIKDYRYVGFGAAFLEDFKLMHMELDISDMDCIEMEEAAYSRQVFNNPYKFVNTFPKTSTQYIDDYFKTDKNQIIWLDFASPGHFSQQLLDSKLIAQKVQKYDVLKLTFNSKLASFISSHHIKCKDFESDKILSYIKNHTELSIYLPTITKNKHILEFGSTVRAMAMRAINYGLKEVSSNLKFHQLNTFQYADGQEMMTLTGIFCTDEEMEALVIDTKIKNWTFYNPGKNGSEFLIPSKILVPVMTVRERMEIDSKIPVPDKDAMAGSMPFKYSAIEGENIEYFRGYQLYYKYLPYFTRVTF